ncbi:MAG: TonB-dependent receptor [Desulfobacterales bacterium]
MKRNFLAFLIILGLFVLSEPVRSADDKDSKSDKTDLITMQEVVVTATRYEEKISFVPTHVSVITDTDISNSTARDIPDLLRTQAGIHVSDIGGNRRTYRVDLRGFGETGHLNTLVLVDGRRINQADLAGTDWALIPLDRVKKIEILWGGRGGVLYGDNASGGVINIITKEGDRFQAGANVSGGSYDTYKGNAHVSGSRGNLSYAFSGRYLNSDGYRDNSDTESKDIGANLGYFFNDRFKLTVSGGYHRDDTGLPGALTESELESGISRDETTSPKDFSDIEDYYAKAKPEIFFLKNSLFQVDLSSRRRESLFFFSFTGGTFEGDTEINTVAVSPQIVVKEKIFEYANNLTAGFDFSNAEEDIFNISLFQGVPTIGRFTLEKANYGYYIHDEFFLTDYLTASGGYRHDRAEYKFDPSRPDQKSFDEDAYTAGINYNFYGNSHLYASFSRSFRYPVLDELFNFFKNTIDIDLMPQTSDDFELGIRHNFTKSLYAKVNVFRIDTEDEIFFNPTTFSNENLDGDTRRDGVEISLGKTFENITIKSSYTFTDAEIRDGQFSGNDVPNVPEHKIALDSVIFLGKGFTLAVNGTYVGERRFESDFSNDFGYQDDYFLLNAKIKYNWKKWELSLDLNNLLDQEYSEYGVLGGSPTQRAFFPSPGINFLLGLSVSY